jgi:hypothetical protein
LKFSNDLTQCPAGIGFKKTIRVDHEIAHFDLTTMPKKKIRPYEDLPLKTETIRRSRDHDKGAVITPKELLPFVVIKRIETFTSLRLSR